MTQIYNPANNGGLEPSMLAFSEDAQAKVKAFFEAVERQAYGGKYGDELKPFAKRATEQLCRVAAVLRLFDDPEARAVQPDAVDRAAELVLYSLEAWRAAFGQKEEASHARHAERLHAWLSKRPGGVTAAAILQTGPKPRSRGLRDAALSILETKNRAIKEGDRWRAL